MDILLRATAVAEPRHFWFRGFRWFVTPLVRRATMDRQKPRILDCGCGTGANIELLNRFGVSYGFDLSEAGLYIGRELGRNCLVRASVTAAPFSSERFDLVTCFDVLITLQEADERVAIAEMYRLTRRGGFVLINVAAMKVLRGDHSVLSREIRRYTRDSLARLVTGAGFEIVRLTYTHAALFLPLLLIRTLHRVRGLAQEADALSEIAVPPSPINAVLSGLLWCESLASRVCGAMPFGSSLLCLARKPEASPPEARTMRRDGGGRQVRGASPSR
jgi:SAM-dependent methyltransferase